MNTRKHGGGQHHKQEQHQGPVHSLEDLTRTLPLQPGAFVEQEEEEDVSSFNKENDRQRVHRKGPIHRSSAQGEERSLKPVHNKSARRQGPVRPKEEEHKGPVRLLGGSPKEESFRIREKGSFRNRKERLLGPVRKIEKVHQKAGDAPLDLGNVREHRAVDQTAISRNNHFNVPRKHGRKRTELSGKVADTASKDDDDNATEFFITTATPLYEQTSEKIQALEGVEITNLPSALEGSTLRADPIAAAKANTNLEHVRHQSRNRRRKKERHDSSLPKRHFTESLTVVDDDGVSVALKSSSPPQQPLVESLGSAFSLQPQQPSSQSSSSRANLFEDETDEKDETITQENLARSR